MKKNVYLVSFLVVALILGAWNTLPAQNVAAQSQPGASTAECRSGVDALTGPLTELAAVQRRARQLCGFSVEMAAIDASNVSRFDREFIEHSIAGNMLEIQSLEYALTRVTDEEWRSLIQMMIAQHSYDLEAAQAIAEKLGLDTSPDLTNMRVYPDTPKFDLGIRRENLVARYLDPLMAAGGGAPVSTPTAIPTLDGTATTVPTDDATATATLVPTLDATVTTVPTDNVTSTATAEPTLDGTTTVVPTVDATGTATSVPTLEPPNTATTVPTLEVTSTATALPPLPTETATALPTTATVPPVDGVAADFDMVSLHIIEEEHVMHVETALVAQRIVTNDEIRAFAKHAADVAGLHLLLMDDLQHRLLDNFTPPPPDFDEEYRGPRRFVSVNTRTNEAGELIEEENEGGE